MKKTILILTISLICLGLNDLEAQTINYGTNIVGVSFSDTTLTQAQQNKIAADIQMCVNNPWGQKADLDIYTNKKPDSDLVGYLDIGTHNICYHNENLEFPNDIVTNNMGNFSLLITKELSDIYTNAFAFTSAYSNEVVAAYEFIEFIAYSNFVNNVSSNQLQNYISSNEGTPEMLANEFDELMKIYFQDKKYYAPSILGFYLSDEWVGTTNLFMQIPVKRNLEPNYWSWTPIYGIWQDNKWKLFLWPEAYAF